MKKGIILFLILAFAISAVSIGETKKDYADLIIGKWIWRGVMEGQNVEIVQQFLQDGRVNFIIYNKQAFISEQALYRIKGSNLLLFLPTGKKWGLSRIVDINKTMLIISEKADFTGEKIKPNLIIYHRVVSKF